MTNNPVQIFSQAFKELFSNNPRNIAIFGGLTALLFAAYIVIPVWATPGNSVSFQLSILDSKDYALFVFLSIVTALLIVMQIYIVRRSRERKRMAMAVGSGGVGVYSALLGGLMATAACTSCIAALLGFLGAGSVFFLVTNRWYFIVGAIILVLVSVYFSARRISGLCEDCEVPKSKTSDRGQSK